MKKLATLLLAAGMVVAASAPANAVDVKVDARYRTSFATGSNGFAGDNVENMMHRMRLGLTMAASENLKAYAQFQINHGNQFGNTTKHGNTGKPDDITARQVYLDWTVPGTSIKVRSGRHDLGLPAEAFGQNSILGGGYGNREGVVIAAPVTDWLGVTALWTRLGTDGTTDLDKNNTDDMYALSANLKFDGVSGAVYAAYATLDDEATYKAAKTNNGWNNGRPAGSGSAYWLGFTSTFTFFDPFTLKVSAAYGEFNADSPKKDQNGWNVQAKAAYKLGFGSVVFGGWYFSGADEDGKGYMPNAGYFSAANHYYDGFAALNNAHGNTNNTGTWAIQAGIEGVSFLSGLAHDLHVTYMEGTNDAKNVGNTFKEKNDNNEVIYGAFKWANYLTEDDRVIEISLNNTYKIYKNLTARLELAYMINDLDNSQTMIDARGERDEDDWFAGLTFDFRF